MFEFTIDEAFHNNILEKKIESSTFHFNFTQNKFLDLSNFSRLVQTLCNVHWLSWIFRWNQESEIFESDI